MVLRRCKFPCSLLIFCCDHNVEGNFYLAPIIPTVLQLVIRKSELTIIVRPTKQEQVQVPVESTIVLFPTVIIAYILV